MEQHHDLSIKAILTGLSITVSRPYDEQNSFLMSQILMQKRAIRGTNNSMKWNTLTVECQYEQDNSCIGSVCNIHVGLSKLRADFVKWVSASTRVVKFHFVWQKII
jgi:hypothetical protein